MGSYPVTPSEWEKPWWAGNMVGTIVSLAGSMLRALDTRDNAIEK